MIRLKQKIKEIIAISLFSGLVLFMFQGCLGEKEIAPSIAPVPEIAKTIASCSDMILMNTLSIPDRDFSMRLDNSVSGSALYECWQPLMKKALEDGRKIPMKHLARAVHVFNRNDSKEEFSLAVYMYFTEIIRGNGTYRDNDRKLLAQYLSFSINNASSKHDANLEKAKLICSRLDPALYRKFFK